MKEYRFVDHWRIKAPWMMSMLTSQIRGLMQAGGRRTTVCAC